MCRAVQREVEEEEQWPGASGKEARRKGVREGKEMGEGETDLE